MPGADTDWVLDDAALYDTLEAAIADCNMALAGGAVGAAAAGLPLHTMATMTTAPAAVSARTGIAQVRKKYSCS